MDYQRQLSYLFFLLTLTLGVRGSYDPDKLSIVLDGNHLADLKSNPATISEGAIEMVRELIKSGKYNIVHHENNFWAHSNQNIYHAVIDEIKAGLDDPSVFLSVPEVQAINNNAFNFSSQYYYSRIPNEGPVETFAGIVKREMDPDTSDNFEYRGRGIDLQNMEELIFNLGAVALKDGFNLGNFVYEIDYSKNPAVCQVKMDSEVYPLSAFVCIENMEMEYRWIDQAARECGYFVIGAEKPFQNVNALLCEPQHVQDFENYFQANLLESCSSAKDCLSGISGEELQNLSRDFLAIMVQTKVQDLREKAYADTSFEFRSEFDQLLDEVASFNLICEKLGIDAMVLGQLNTEETSAYEARIDEMNSAFESALAPLVSSETLDEMRDKGTYLYKKCVLTKKQQNESNPRPDGFFEDCEREALRETLGELVRNLAFEKGGNLQEIENLVRNSLSSMCPFNEEKNRSWGYNSQRADLNNFDYRYDMNRCASAIDRIIGDFEAYAGLSSNPLSAFARNLRSVSNERIDNLLRQNTQECLEGLRRRERDESSKIQQCYEQAVVESRAESMIESIVLSSSPSAPVRRDSSLTRDVLRLGESNESVGKCLRGETTNSSELRACQETIRTEVVERLPSGLFSSRANSAAAALQADLEMLTKELTREISVFHWASDELSGNDVEEPVPLTSWNAYKYAVGREYMFHAGPFLNSRVEGAGATVAGRGLYAASDPNSTRDYGQTLFEIRIPENSRFLDLREGSSEGGIPISKDTYDKMVEEGCDFTSREREQKNEMSPNSASYRLRRDNGYYSIVSKTLFEQHGACHDIFSDAISGLDVNFLAYSYGSAPASFCDSSANNQPAAFVMIDNRMRGNVRNYNTAQIDAAIERSEETGRPLPEDIRRILQLNTNFYRTNESEHREQLDSETINFWKSRLFNCDASYEEDRVDSGFNNRY